MFSARFAGHLGRLPVSQFYKQNWQVSNKQTPEGAAWVFHPPQKQLKDDTGANSIGDDPHYRFLRM